MPADGEVVLAETREGALWLAATPVSGHVHFRSALPLLELTPEGSLAQVFGGAHFLPNLLLIQTLAQSGLRALHPHNGQVRAAFMFDDPNLHWPTYGYLKYREIIDLAEKENFHTSFATIPLDTWFTHGRTAREFRDHSDRLSLLVHGNDHSRHELAQRLSPAARCALLSQARRRIERLERHSRLTVDRVMVPPHGACSDEMLSTLPGAGFEGACISSGSLQAHNPKASWVRSLGFRPVESILGCSVLPRWSFAARTGELLLAAYLGRPIVLRGHHGDLKHGLDVLTEHARLINSLGVVRWARIADLLRSSYGLRRSGTTAYIAPYVRHIEVHIPAGIENIAIESSPFDQRAASRYVLRGAAHPGTTVGAGQPATVRSHDVLTITSDEGSPPGRPLTATFRMRAKPYFRRALTEVRDRLMPLTAA